MTTGSHVQNISCVFGVHTLQKFKERSLRKGIAQVSMDQQ